MLASLMIEKCDETRFACLHFDFVSFSHAIPLHGGGKKKSCFALRVVSFQLIMLSTKKDDSVQPLSLLLFWRPPRSSKHEASKH